MPNRHAEAAELDDDVLAFAELGDAGLPYREGFLLLVRVGADAERSADMVEDDRGLREGPSEVGQIEELGMVEPCLEG